MVLASHPGPRIVPLIQTTLSIPLARALSVHDRAKNRSKARRVVAKVEFHPGELFPRVGFIVTNRSLPNERVLALYNQRGTAEQQIKEGKYALKWTKQSVRDIELERAHPELAGLFYDIRADAELAAEHALEG